jgi:hypothetical protein
MKTVSSSVSETRENLDAQASDIPYGEGVAAGLIGAGTVAIWFFVLDLVKGRPLYTPAILGRAVFRGFTNANTFQQPDAPFELIVSFTWLHGLVFCAIGLIGVWLIHKAEVSPHFGYGIALLLTIMLSGFIVICMLFAEPILHAITIPSILIGNLLAMAAMGVFFWRRHPKLKALP